MISGSPLAAGRKTNSTYEVQDSAGGSGLSGASSQEGFRLTSSAGLPAGAVSLSAPSGTELLPGLWGGAPGFRAFSAATFLAFGDLSRPAQLVIPPNALAQDYIVYATNAPASRPMRASPQAIALANQNLDRSGNRFTRPLDGQLWEILAHDALGLPFEGLLKEPAVLSLPYRDDDNDGLVDGTSPAVRASTLSVWRLDEEHTLWVKLQESSVDASAKRVSAPVRRFSVFTVMGAPGLNASDSFAFPVPWRPNGPGAGAGAGQTGTSAGGITFSNLPSAGRIRIYTLSGALVRELDIPEGLYQRNWDARSESGEDVGTGTYIYVVDSGTDKKAGKLAIIR